MEPLPVESFHTILFCRKWDACVAFYRDILGFAVVDEKPGFMEFQVTPESRIGLLQSAANSTPGADETFSILSFRVKNIEEIHKALSGRFEGLTALRLHPWGAHLFELRDPEGRRLEFWAPV